MDGKVNSKKYVCKSDYEEYYHFDYIDYLEGWGCNVLNSVVNQSCYENFLSAFFSIGGYEGAITLITPSQVCTCRTFHHESGAKAMGRVMFQNVYYEDDSFDFLHMDDYFFRDNFFKKNHVIVVQWVSDSAFSLIFFPNKINDFQYQQLVCLEKKLEMILGYSFVTY